MFTSLLKIGLLSFISAISPLKAVSSSYEFAADNEVVYNDSGLNVYRAKLEDSLPTFDSSEYSDFNISGTFELSYIRTYTYSIGTFTNLELYTIANDVVLRAINPRVNWVNLFTYSMVNDTYTFDSTYGYDYFIKMSDIDNNGYDNWFDTFSMFFQTDNGYITLRNGYNYGGIIGASNLFLPFASGTTFQTYNPSLYVDLNSVYNNSYLMASGLFYLPYYDDYFTSIRYTVASLGTDDYFKDSNGNIYQSPSNYYYVSSIALAYDQDDFESSISSYRIIAYTTSTLEDGHWVYSTSFRLQDSTFYVFGGEMPDIEYMNNMLSDLNIYHMFDNISANTIDLSPYIYVDNNDSGITPYVSTGFWLKDAFNLINLGITGLINFMNIKVFPDLTIGAFILVPFAVSLLIIVLKLFKR